MIETSGGRGGARTPGLIVANDALSQLSYTPTAQLILANERGAAKPDCACDCYEVESAFLDQPGKILDCDCKNITSSVDTHKVQY